MEYRILGPLEVAVAGRAIALGPPKQRAVLAVLLLHLNEIVATDRLIELVWGLRPPRTAAHSVQIYISNLRKALSGPETVQPIVTRSPGYLLEADPEAVDAVRFARQVEEGSRRLGAGDPQAAGTALRAALGLWRGAPLVDFAYEEFAQPHTRRLEELRAHAVEQLAEAELALGNERHVLSELERLVHEQPLREGARALHLLALYRCGRQAEALRSYQAFRRQLTDELGIDPSPALQRLQEQILLQDPALLPPTRAEAIQSRNPYKGLQPFDEPDAGDFFGRSALTEELCRALSGGAPFLALVGPSGSGKSSVLLAGLIPALRAGAVPGSERWSIVRLRPGVQPLAALRAALAAEGRPLVVIVDQFEELFSLLREDNLQAFLHTLVGALDDPTARVRAVVTLRADFYGRPLLYPEFARLFTAGVVNVMPLTAAELEAALVQPAKRAGADVEPALIAELVADAVNQPGALPLFQYTLTELFDQRRSRALTVEGYHRLGGVTGAVSRRAETLYAGLEPAQQEAAQQMFLRLVTPGEGTPDARRRARVTELASLDLDAVDVAAVLDRFGRHRLLTFDRDPEHGHPTVEVAHEALLSAWQRLRAWIDSHRADLRTYHAFQVLVREWDVAGRDADYLLSGSRLDQYETWSRHSALQLVPVERAFLRASIERRQADEAREAARQAAETRLRSRARRSLLALFGTVALLTAVTAALLFATIGARPPDVALVFDGRGSGFTSMIGAGFDRAVEDFGLDAEEVVPLTPTRLRRVADQGVPLVILPGTAVLEPENLAWPETLFAILDAPGEPVGNVVLLRFAEEEGSFLVGAAAALKSATGRIGFVGGVDDPLIHKFRAGFEAGARHVRPEIVIDSVYLTRPPDYSGFDSPTLGFQAAATMYDAGADVVYHASGGSGYGVFEAAVLRSRAHARQLWAIGVDADEHEASAGLQPLWVTGPEDWREHILTSMVKRLDLAVYWVIEEFVNGTLGPGSRVLGLADGGIDYATSGGFIDDIVPELERLKREIITGAVRVPPSLE
jgi:basic membrane lipoprotein Med (substrate-binding protein (PBP1-ABC) superfamily)/DNA-binding SARP family transcriptional activator